MLNSAEHAIFLLINVKMPTFKVLCLGKLSMTFFITSGPGLEVINFFSCSTQLSMKFSLLINVNMPTTVGILTFMSMKIAF